MTSYTDNRRYPYPSSEREAGNGAAGTEALARAVAADLDTLDAGWALQSTRPVKILGLASTLTGFTNGVRSQIAFTQVNKVIQPAYFSSSISEMRVLVDGWYFADLNFHAVPSGTVTVNARLQNWLNHYRPSTAGVLVHVDPGGERFGDTYWPSATADCFNRVSGMFRAIAGDRFIIEMQHSNVGSTVNFPAVGTYLEVTRMCGL